MIQTLNFLPVSRALSQDARREHFEVAPPTIKLTIPVPYKLVPAPIDLGAETDRLFLLLFGTGVRGRTSLNAVKLKVGDVDVPAQFAGAQGAFAGLDQINFELPRSLKGRGEVTINCVVDARSANPVSVVIQ